jgi:electron transfer flavoprotein alpha subunit
MKQDIYLIIEHHQGQVSDLSYMMVAAAQEITSSLGGSIIAVMFGHQQQGAVNDLAVNRVLYFDHPLLASYSPGVYQHVIAAIVEEHRPRLLVFGDTSAGSETAGCLSARFDLPIISSCRSLQIQDGRLTYTSQICGGKMMVQGEIPTATTLVTLVPGAYKKEQGKSSQPPILVWADVPAIDKMPVKLVRMIAPDAGDVDISKERVLVSIGRGIENQDNIQIVQELADALGGVVCASRPVVDQGWLAATRLVGKSGKRVKPKIYLALGISGAPEHVEAISDSELIVAVNTDPLAPIFNVAQFGAVVDLFDLVPALTESIRYAKTAQKA